MRTPRLLVLLLVVSLVVPFVPVSGETTERTDVSLDSCTTISTPGRYVLSTDIENSTAETCLEIRSDDVTLDGRGRGIDGLGTNGSIGVSVRGARNVTVRNLTVTEWETGVGYRDTTDGTVRNVRVADNGWTGVHLDSATETELTNVTAATNVDPQRRPFPGPSKSAGIFVTGSTATHIHNATLSRNVGGVSFIHSTDSVVTDSVAQSNEVGFFLRGTNDTVRGSVAAGNNVAFFADNASDASFSDLSTVSNRVGIGVDNSTNTTVDDANATSGLLGVSVVESRGTTLGNVTTTDEFVGVNFLDSSDNTLTASRVEISEFIGVGLVGTTATRISNTTVVASNGNTSVPGATSAGIYLNDSSADFHDVTTRKNENWTVFAERDSTVDATNLSLDGARLSFSGRNVALDSTERPLPPPNHVPVGRSLVVSETSPDPTLDLRLAYDRRDALSAGVDETTLRLWRYDGNWSKVADSGAVRGAPAVSANFSRPERSVVTVLGERNGTEST